MRRLVTLVVLVLVTSGLTASSAAAVNADNPSPVNYGSVVVGRSRTTTIWLRHDNVEAILSATPNVASVTVDASGCGLFTTCALRATFTPTGLGPMSGSITVVGCDLVPFCPHMPVLATIQVSGNGVSSVASRAAPYWPGWKIARGVALTSFGDSGYVVDGFGGIHPFSNPLTPIPPATHGGGYWPGHDVVRGIALLPDNSGGYILDYVGRLHPFRVGSSASPPLVTNGPLFGFDIARGETLTGDGTGGYVLDGYGGLHAFSIGANPKPFKLSGPYWKGFNIARGLALEPRSGGYVLDGFGGVHALAKTFSPVPTGGPYWRGWDIARGLAFSPGLKLAVIVDAFGGLHHATIP